MQRNKKIIFITGAGHSGSTLLGCILGSHPKTPFKYFHVGEVHAFFTPSHNKYGKIYTPFPEIGHKFWKSIDYSVGASKAYSEIFKKSGTNIIIDSSKNIKWLNLQMANCAINSWHFEVIVSIRSSVDIWLSSEKRGYSEQKMISNIMYYHHLYSFLKTVYVKINTIDISFLIENPKKMAGKLCNITKIPFFIGKEEYWNYKHCHLFGAAAQLKHLNDPKNASYYKRFEDSKKIENLPLNSNQRKNLEAAELFFFNRLVTNPCKNM